MSLVAEQLPAARFRPLVAGLLTATAVQMIVTG